MATSRAGRRMALAEIMVVLVFFLTFVALGRTAVRVRRYQHRLAALSAAPQRGSLVHDGRIRTYTLYVPRALPAAPVPLVVMLHGGGGTGAGAMAATEGRWNELAEQYGFVVVYPDGINHHWHDCRADESTSTADDVGFVRALVGAVAGQERIDLARVYAAGHSNGGMLSLRLGIEASDVFAAVASHAGLLAATSECAAPAQPVPLLLVAGTADPIMPFGGGLIRAPGGGNSGAVRSAAATVSAWLAAWPAAPAVTTTALPDLVPDDGSTVIRTDYTGAVPAREVLLYQVSGGGHGWQSPTPGAPLVQLLLGPKNQDLDGCDVTWAFFRHHSRR